MGGVGVAQLLFKCAGIAFARRSGWVIRATVSP